MEKGQVEPLTAALITSLILASVGTVYVWGTPLLEKREAESQMVGVENNLIQLQNTIHDVEASGEGSTEKVDLNLPDDAEVTIDEETDTIKVVATTEESIYAPDTRFTLSGSNVTKSGEYDGDTISYGLEGVNDPSLIEVETVSSSGGSSQITYDLILNNLFTTTYFGEALVVRDLQLRSGNDVAGGMGESEIVIQNGGSTVEEEAATIDEGIVDVQKQVTEVSIN